MSQRFYTSCNIWEKAWINIFTTSNFKFDVIVGNITYVVEGDLQPEAFGSIPRALWVSSAALLSTGYGDYTPITFLGRFAAVCTALFGIGAVALPAGILASAFTERKRKKY